MTDPAAIDLESCKKFREVLPTERVDDLIAAVEALREREADWDGDRRALVNRVVTLTSRAEYAEAHAAELAGALAKVVKCWDAPPSHSSYGDRMKPHIVVARTALASTPAAALERARAKDEVITWTREIVAAGDVVGPSALRRLDALDQGDGT